MQMRMDALHFEGSGVLEVYLEISFQKMITSIFQRNDHRLIPDENVKQYWLSTECYGGMGLLKQWRNEVGVTYGCPILPSRLQNQHLSVH